MDLKRIAAVIVAVMLLFVFASCGASQQTELTKVTLSEVTHSVFYAPQYAAMALGYFEDEGIELELVNGGGADKVMTAVLSGQVDIGLSGPEACIYVYNEGGDCPQVFCQLTKRDGSFLVGRDPEDDFTFDKLKGKHVLSGRAGGMPYMSFEYMLGGFGVTPENTELDTSVAFDSMAGAFTGGTADYVVLFEPTASALELEGKGHVLASIGEHAGEIPYTAYYASEDFFNENPHIIEGFTRAIYRAQQWIEIASAEEVATAIAPYFPDSDIDVLKMVVDRYRAIDAWSKDPFLTEDSLNRLQDVMEASGELEDRVTLEDISDMSFASIVTGK